MTDKDNIQLEAALLKSMTSKDTYDKYYNTLDTKKLIPLTANLLRDYGTYFAKYNEDINWDTFYTEFTHNWRKQMSVDDVTYYRDIVFPAIESSVVTESLYVALAEREASVRIQEIMDEGFSADSVADILASLKDKLAPHTKIDSRFKKMTEVDLSSLDNEGGVTWCSPALQTALGSLVGGQFWVLAADTGAGKSALAITQVAHTIKLKTGRPVLYFDSEHTEEELRGRVLSNLYSDKVTEGFEGIADKQERIYTHFNETYGENSFISYQLRTPNDLRMIEKAIEQFDPCLIVIDMLDKMSNSLAITDLTPLYDKVRTLSNMGYPIIGTSQSGDTTYWAEDSEGKSVRKRRKHLSDKDLAGSKSGKQGAAYGLLMIGQDDDTPGVRYVSTTKKKRGNNCSVVCTIDEKYSLYSELY